MSQPPPIAPQVRKLDAELRTLRKGRGITVAGLSGCSTIQTALNAQTVAGAHDRLMELISTLGNSREVEALRNAYGIGWSEPQLLKHRREVFGKSVDRHVDSVEVWENAAIRDLAFRLSGMLGVFRPAGTFRAEVSIVDKKIKSINQLYEGTTSCWMSSGGLIFNRLDPKKFTEQWSVGVPPGPYLIPQTVTIALKFEIEPFRATGLEVLVWETPRRLRGKPNPDSRVAFVRTVRPEQTGPRVFLSSHTWNQVHPGDLYQLTWTWTGRWISQTPTERSITD